MHEDLLIVLLCELGERLLALRETLTEPSVMAKPHAQAVAALLTHGLEAVEEQLQRDVLPCVRGDRSADAAGAFAALDACGRALRALHRRLDLLDIRWSVAPIDIFLRKLRDDVGDLPHPAVALSGDYAAFDDDLAAGLCAALNDAGLLVAEPPHGTPVIALPRLEATNPLAWPLLLPALVRLQVARAQRLRFLPPDDAARAQSAAVARLGGPAAFAARAAHALLTTPAEAPAWPAVAALAEATRAIVRGLEGPGARQAEDGLDGFATSRPLDLFTRLLRGRDRFLGLETVAGAAYGPGADRGPVSLDAGVALPKPALPTAAEAAALLDKLAAGTPINAVDPPLPSDFVERLDAVGDAAAFYDLIEPLGERPASLAAILGVGWLYKVRYSYPLFRDAVRRDSLREALAAYRVHMTERNDLLLQSIEASHVQGIFLRGRLEG